MSHTLTVKIAIKDHRALDAAVRRMGGAMLGEGSHKLFSSAESGIGFKLPGWSYPLIAREDGSLAYDDYHGRWGNPADIEALENIYGVEAARFAAQGLGWIVEDNESGGVTIYHPEGGTLTLSPGGRVDAQGFHGEACAAATRPISEAMGQTTSETRKKEWDETDVQQQISDAD